MFRIERFKPIPEVVGELGRDDVYGGRRRPVRQHALSEAGGGRNQARYGILGYGR